MKLNMRIKCTVFADLSADIPGVLAFALMNACGNEIPSSSPLGMCITDLLEDAKLDCAFYSVDIEEAKR